MTRRMTDREIVEPRDRAEWRAWLERNAASSTGTWVAIHKKGSAGRWLALAEAVEEALCFGWIDSRAQRLDDHRYKVTFTPRKPGSIWAASNKRRVAELIASGAMTPAGLAVVEAAKRDGSWEILDQVDALVIPADLADALAANEEAAFGFDAFPDSYQKQLLYWVLSAKRPATRTKRIEETVRQAEENAEAHDRE